MRGMLWSLAAVAVCVAVASVFGPSPPPLIEAKPIDGPKAFDTQKRVPWTTSKIGGSP